MLRYAFGGFAAALLIGGLTPARADSFESANAPGLCLTVNVGASSIQPCDGSTSQDFALYEDPQSGQTALVIGLSCIAMSAPNQMLGLAQCAEPVPPQMLFDLSGGTLVSNGLCVDVKGGGRNPGTRVIAFQCNGKRNQGWIQRQTGIDTQSGMNRVFERAATGKLSVNSNPSLCLGIGPGNMGELQPCSVVPSFRVIVGGSPTFVASVDNADGRAMCLSPSGTSGRPLQFVECVSAIKTGDMTAIMKWGFTSQGLLRNEASLCADAEGKGDRPGTKVQFWKCHGNPNQRFTLIQ